MPRSLILALCGEAGELAELLQWTNDVDVEGWLSDPANQQKLRNERVDLEQALIEKIELNQDLGIHVCPFRAGQQEATTARLDVVTAQAACEMATMSTATGSTRAGPSVGSRRTPGEASRFFTRIFHRRWADDGHDTPRC